MAVLLLFSSQLNYQKGHGWWCQFSYRKHSLPCTVPMNGLYNSPLHWVGGWSCDPLCPMGHQQTWCLQRFSMGSFVLCDLFCDLPWKGPPWTAADFSASSMNKCRADLSSACNLQAQMTHTSKQVWSAKPNLNHLSHSWPAEFSLIINACRKALCLGMFFVGGDVVYVAFKEY